MAHAAGRLPRLGAPRAPEVDGRQLLCAFDRVVALRARETKRAKDQRGSLGVALRRRCGRSSVFLVALFF